MPTTLSPIDQDDLRYAKALLQNPSIAIKIANLVGVPLEKGFDLLPKNFSTTLHKVTTKALRSALRYAVLTMGAKQEESSEFIHKMMVGLTGAAGGAFGLPALSIELPLSTIIMLRSIADVARSEGEKIKTIDAQLACLEVFAFGGPSAKDDAAESGYFAVRAALARTMSEAGKYIAERGLAEEGAPALVRLIAGIASRFGVTVSEKAAAQAVPVIGAAGGAAINTIFIDHYQNMARGHFTVRKLERVYGPQEIRHVYDKL